MDAQSVLSVAKKTTVWVATLLAGFASGCATLPEGGRVDTFPITAVAFSPDGGYLAGGANKQVQVYEASTLRLVKVLTVPEAKANIWGNPLLGPVVAFSNDSTMLAASGIADRTIVWDTATWKEIRQFPDQKRARSIAFAPDGRLLAAAGPDSQIRLWEIDTGTLAKELAAHHQSPAYSVAFSPDGELLASSGADSTARLWNRATGNLIQTLPMDSPLVTGVAFSPDGTLLATTAGGYEVKLWKVQTGEAASGITDVEAEKAKQSKSAITLSVLSNVGAALAGMPSLLQVGPRPSRPPSCDPTVVFSPDGRLVARVLFQPGMSGDYHAFVTNLDSKEHIRISGIYGCGLAFSPDGNVLASPSLTGAPSLWDPYTGKKVTLKK